MKKIILHSNDIFRVITGNTISLEITIEQAFRLLASRKIIDNSNSEYSIKPNSKASDASSVETPKDASKEDTDDT